jgi:hypothetical protein
VESELIIEFLRNALRQKRLEDRLINQAIADLRSTLAAVEGILQSSAALAIGPARQRSIEAVAAAVARNVQQTWGIPQLASLQQALEPFIEQQLKFGRRVVELAGGTLSAPGTANLAAAQAVNNAVIGGKTLAETLTTSFPALVADRVERYLRLGLQQAAAEVEIIGYKDAVVAVSERNVTAIIRTGVQEVASAAQQAIYALESDPAWLEGRLTWTAVLDSAVCPVCIGLDGREFELGQPGPYFDGRNRISPHPQCRCYMLPSKWREETMQPPDGGKPQPVARPAEGDSGEQTVSFRKTVNQWLRDNPETTKEIFGKRLGSRLLDREDKLDLPSAIRLWQAPKGS